MKLALFCFCLCFTGISYATSWNDLRIERNYHLLHDLALPVGSSEVLISGGASLFYLEKVYLDAIRVALYRFELESCDYPKTESEMMIVDTGEAEVGVVLKKQCMLEVFMEIPDEVTLSLLGGPDEA